MTVQAPAPRRSSRFLRDLRAALLADLEPELVLCEKLAVFQAAGWKRSEIRRKLNLTSNSAALRAAEERLKRAAQRLGNDE